jgi:hypothetical protein
MAKETGMEMLDYLKQIEDEYKNKSESLSLRHLDPEQVLFIS